MNTITREQVEGWTKMLQATSPRDACLFLSLFEGISGDYMSEIIEMKLSDFHPDEGTITLCTGRTIPVSSLLYTYAQQTSEMTSFEGARRTLPVIEEERVFKRHEISSEDSHNRWRGLRREFDRIVNRLGVPDLTPKELNEFGRLDLIMSYAKATGLEPTMCMKFYKKEIINKYGTFRPPKFWEQYGK